MVDFFGFANKQYIPLEKNAILGINNQDSKEISDWQTYKNSKYKYEIQYPKDFEIKIQSDILQYIQNKKNKSNQIEISVLQEVTKRDKFGNTIEFQDGRWNSFELFTKYINKFVEQLATAGITDESKLYSQQVINLNGYKAIMIKNREFPNSGRIMIYHSQKGFQVGYYAVSLEYEKVIDQILSSFRFVE